jgi:hypothetical protein
MMLGRSSGVLKGGDLGRVMYAAVRRAAFVPVGLTPLRAVIPPNPWTRIVAGPGLPGDRAGGAARELLPSP